MIAGSSHAIAGHSYETEESLHGRQEPISADGLFFSFRFRPMARWIFLALRWRGQIGIQEFLQPRARIPDRSGARTGEGDGGVCGNCSDLGLAGNLHGCHCGEVVEQRSSVASWRVSDQAAFRSARLIRQNYCGLGQRNSPRYSGVCSGAKPWRLVFSVTTRGMRKFKR